MQDWQALARQWSEWAASSYPGDPERQRRAAAAAMDALRAGRSNAEAAAAAQTAAAGVPPARAGFAGIERRTLTYVAASVAALAVMAGVLVLSQVLRGGSAAAADHRSADRIVADAATRFRGLHSYNAVVQLTGGGTNDIQYADAATVEQHLQGGGKEVDVIAAGGHQYLKASASFYDHNPVLAQHAGDQWLAVPDGTTVLDTTRYSPATGAGCLFDHHGRLTRRGTRSVRGSEAIEVDDAGGVPGSTPARFFFATDGSNDLLRVEATGVSDGAVDRSCQYGLGLDVQKPAELATIDFYELGLAIAVSPPAQAIDLTAEPWCGQPLGVADPVAQQYLVLFYDGGLRDAAIAAECGCPNPDLFQLHQGLTDEVADDTAYIAGLRALPRDPKFAADIDAVIAAVQAEDANTRAELANLGSRSFDVAARLAVGNARSQAVIRLRTDLGLRPSGTCQYLEP